MVGIENLVTVCLDVLQLPAEGQPLGLSASHRIYSCYALNRLWGLLAHRTSSMHQQHGVQRLGKIPSYVYHKRLLVAWNVFLN